MPRPPSAIFSDRFGSFVSLACMRDHRQRPSAGDLLGHPFVAHLDERAVCAATITTLTAAAAASPPPLCSSSSPSPSPSPSPSSASSSGATAAAAAARRKSDATAGGGRAARPFLSGNSRNYTASLSAAGGRGRPRHAASDSAPILPLLTHPNPGPGPGPGPSPALSATAQQQQQQQQRPLERQRQQVPARTRTDDLSSADIRKLVKYWKAYATQLHRFNSTFPAVLSIGQDQSAAAAAAPGSVTSRYRTPRAGPRSDRCKSEPATARTEAGALPGALSQERAQVPLDLDPTVLERLAEGLACDAGWLMPFRGWGFQVCERIHLLDWLYVYVYVYVYVYAYSMNIRAAQDHLRRSRHGNASRYPERGSRPCSPPFPLCRPALLDRGLGLHLHEGAAAQGPPHPTDPPSEIAQHRPERRA